MVIASTHLSFTKPLLLVVVVVVYVDVVVVVVVVYAVAVGRSPAIYLRITSLLSIAGDR